RRRHTRFSRDWSSDVCSSDLIATARRLFEEVSALVVTLLRKFGNPLEERLHVATCPMALEGRAAEWVQRGERVENPYRGQRMLRCGAIDEEVEPTERLGGARPPRPADAPPTH